MKRASLTTTDAKARLKKAAAAAAATLLCLGLAGTALASGGEGGGVSDHQMWDFIFRLMNFAVMALVLVVLLRKPLKSGLANRSQTIADELAELEKRRDQARKEVALMEKRLADAEAEREAILAEFRAQGEREKQRILDEAQAMAERIKGQAKFTIEQEIKAAKAELRREVAEMSAALAEDLLKEHITAEDQSRLVDEYLTKVGQEVQ